MSVNAGCGFLLGVLVHLGKHIQGIGKLLHKRVRIAVHRQGNCTVSRELLGYFGMNTGRRQVGDEAVPEGMEVTV